jgi:hypothetical protein
MWQIVFINNYKRKCILAVITKEKINAGARVLAQRYKACLACSWPWVSPSASQRKRKILENFLFLNFAELQGIDIGLNMVLCLFFELSTTERMALFLNTQGRLFHDENHMKFRFSCPYFFFSWNTSLCICMAAIALCWQSGAVVTETIWLRY